MSPARQPANEADRLIGGDMSTELSARRTGMSFQRTRLSADRTLMSVIRTALSLIGFGFTIFQAFRKAYDANLIASSRAASLFGEALVLLGSAMLLLGIVYHVRFMLELRRNRDEMHRDGLIHAESEYPYSMTLLTAILLLGLGVIAMASMVLEIGPLG